MLNFVNTADGSKTLFNAQVGEHYHSVNGALQESNHVFINAGLRYFTEQTIVGSLIKVLEVGFGTGLNFLLSAEYCTKNKTELLYTGIEAYPLARHMILQTGYDGYVSPEVWKAFSAQYQQTLQQQVSLNEYCSLHIAHCLLINFTDATRYDIVYFDAFAAVHQPEMWTDESLAHVCSFLKPAGIFVTYAITGKLKRSLNALGFTIEKIPGAAGKREMLRAIKNQ